MDPPSPAACWRPARRGLFEEGPEGMEGTQVGVREDFLTPDLGKLNEFLGLDLLDSFRHET